MPEIDFLHKVRSNPCRTVVLAKSYSYPDDAWIHSASLSAAALPRKMPKNSPCFRPLMLCHSHVIAGICTLFACLLASAAIADSWQLDSTFGTGGKLLTSLANGNSGAAAVKIDSQGRLVVAAYCPGSSGTDLCILRYLYSGLIDFTFGVGGVARAEMTAGADYPSNLLIQPDGKLVVVGHCYHSANSASRCVARFETDGTLDAQYGNGGKQFLDFEVALSRRNIGAALLSSGSMLVLTNCPEPCVAKLNENGILDATFGSEGVALLTVQNAWSLLILPSGHIVVGATCGSAPGANDSCIAKLLADGTTDASFGLSGIASIDFQAPDALYAGIVLAADGEIAIASQSSNTLRVAMVTPSGTKRTSYGISGIGRIFTPSTSNGIGQLLVDSQNRVVAAANCRVINPAQPPTIWLKPCVARWTVDGQPDYSFADGGLSRVFLPQPLYPVVDLYEETVAGAALDSMGQIVVAGGCGEYPASSICLARLKHATYDALTCPLNADANDTTDAATDAILLTRYLIGIRGHALTSGALGQNPTRTGQALETYLASLDLDVDGDGQSLATTDGLLLLRAMLGLTGDALTQGATNASHPNVRNAQQILTWIESTHGVACLP